MNWLVSVMEMQCVYCTFEWLILLLERSEFLLNWVHNIVYCVMWCHLLVLLVRMFGIRNLSIRLQSWIQKRHYYSLQILANKIYELFKEIMECVLLVLILFAAEFVWNFTCYLWLNSLVKMHTHRSHFMWFLFVWQFSV